MNDLTPEQIDARNAAAKSTLLRALDSIEAAIASAREDAPRLAVEAGTHVTGEPYIEGVVVVWSVRWADETNADGERIGAHTSGGWDSTVTPRAYLRGMLTRLAQVWEHEDNEA